jgi:predicted amidophosphoribosyltransferase
MSPRILDTRTCPHCKAALPLPTPRVCPQCAGSLQQRFQKFGCLTTAPKLFLLGVVAWVVRELVRMHSA